MTPRATLRLQLSKAFSFEHALRLVPYLSALGISHLYTSPILAARAGSTHGYDVIDPTRVNPELGGEEGLERLVHALRSAGLGLIVDIVPNHMAVASQNRWLWDTLKKGQSSRYAKVFDIDWAPDDPTLRGKMLLPLLSRPYGEALSAGEIGVWHDPDAGDLTVRCSDEPLPVTIPPDERSRFAAVECDACTEHGRGRLHDLLERQHYRLAWWKVANDALNWRRFFDINELIGVRVEDESVFEETHQTLFGLYEAGLVDGFRVDHIDGLADPGEYCRRLRRRLSELESRRPPRVSEGPAYLVVEKILSEGERMPSTWGVDGTSGYDFMDQVSGVFHDPSGERPLSELWHRISGRAFDFEAEEAQARCEMLDRVFRGSLEATASAFWRLARDDIATRDLSRVTIRRCLAKMLRRIRRYRTYIGSNGRSAEDGRVLADLFEHSGSQCDRYAMRALDRWFDVHGTSPETQTRAVTGFQQLSSALTAKAVEDTAFYRYGRLLSRVDVGFNVRRFAFSPADFHASSSARRMHFPTAMLATATHDHKRGEDVRARLAVLSEIPRRWSAKVARWAAMNGRFRSHSRPDAPSAADEAILYQMIVGAWPPGLDPGNADGVKAYAGRLAAWQLKALREAKLQTSWIESNLEYERAAEEFLSAILSPGAGFLRDVAKFVRYIAPAGAAKGLGQLILKLSSPGIPDIYQGTDYWDFSLVDPDNRGAVDFDARAAALGRRTDDMAKLARRWQDGRIKQALMARTLAFRAKATSPLQEGSYEPLEISGAGAQGLLAFARRNGTQTAIVVVMLAPMTFLARTQSISPRRGALEGISICLPDGYPAVFDDQYLGGAVRSREGAIAVGDLLTTLPVALIKAESQ